MDFRNGVFPRNSRSSSPYPSASPTSLIETAEPSILDSGVEKVWELINVGDPNTQQKGPRKNTPRPGTPPIGRENAEPSSRDWKAQMLYIGLKVTPWFLNPKVPKPFFAAQNRNPKTLTSSSRDREPDLRTGANSASPPALPGSNPEIRWLANKNA